MFRRKIVTKIYCTIIAGSMLWSAPCFAGPQIPGFYGKLSNLTPPVATAVPQLKGIVQGVTNVVHDQAQNKLTVNQDKPKAILDWNSFDIGQDAWTHFNQQGNKDWAALNRIWDRNPSQIYGKLTADGKVYLINQNGILFGPGSRVNVHSLIGSSLNLKDDDFLNGVLKFKAENYMNPADPVNSNVAVSNHGLIETDEAGEVFLLAPHVENSGDITAPIGQIGLAAGSDVEIKPWTPPVGGSSTDIRSALLVGVERSGAGLAQNLEGGWLVADLGLAGMYGRVVNQEGVIRSVTAVKKQGEIELLASEKISTGKRSVTSAEISDSQEKVNQTFQFKPGSIKVRGLNPDPYSTEATGAIEHRGLMEAPAGNVTMLASDYVFLEKDSRIDISGKWVNSTAEGNLVESQLNSVQLRDDYGQKEGLLKGQKVKFDAYLGSAIGDVSGALGAVEVTALDQAMKGGSAEIWAANGNILMKDGALIDFSGGGIRYNEGHMDTTKLLSGRQVIDISDAPQWIAYDRIMGLHQTFHTRYGVKEEFRGLFTGGANALRNSSGERVEGKDAGSLTLVAGRMFLDGVLDGSVTKGLYQTEKTELLSDLGNQKTRGTKEPKAGSLLLGYPDSSGSTILRDYILGDVRIKAHGEPLPNGFLPGDPLPGASASSVSTLSAGLFNAAGLSSLMIYSNLGITIEEEARISLSPGGTFRASSRAIELRGEVSVPAGQISLSTSENKTSDAAAPGYIPLVGDGNIFLAGTSRILAGGQRIDNFLAGKDMSAVLEPGRQEGGSVSLGGGWFDTHGIVMKKGAVIDVSGGYLMDAKGGVTGGNAGSASLLAPTLILEGDLRGHSLLDKKGGTLILRASRSSVVPAAPKAPAHLEFDSPLPADFAGTLQLGKAQIEETGFTAIEVSSVYDLTVNQGVHFSPSRVNLATPVPLSGSLNVGNVRNNVTGAVIPSEGAGGLLKTDLVNIGASSIKLTAGVDLTEGFSANDTSLIDIQPAATLTAGPAGAITMDAPAISVAGTLDAPGGRLDLRARQFDLILKSSATLNAKGYNKPEAKPVMAGYPLGYTPLTGGEVKLEATFGNLLLERGAAVDVSGSEPVETFLKAASGSPEAFTVASDPGSVTLSFLNRLDLGGQLLAHASLAGIRGGSLTVSKRDPSQGLDVTSADLALFASQGFDSLAFQSKKGLNFTGTMEIPIGRSLTLDAPEIRAASGSAVTLSAPWVRIANDPAKYVSNDNAYTLIPPAATGGSSQLALRGQWIDIEGSVVLSGFSALRLEAGQDIRMSDRFYTGAGSRWEGRMKVSGELEMSAGRIYPTTLAAFVVDAADQVTILPGKGATEGFSPSAGGSLLIEANAIDHRGLLAAPLGSIELRGKGAESLIDLGSGSLISTAGLTAINAGALIGDFWQVPDRPTDTQLVDLSESPRKSIKISADTVTFRKGGALDVSGGGSIFTYQFLTSPEGSSNPLQKTGRYVILPDSPKLLPGDGVYLEGGAGLAAGVYSLLPAEYAFVPGAMVLTDLNKAGQSYVVDQERSVEGYPLVKGYSAVVGTDTRSPKPKGFSVRPAKEVLKEGYFDFKELVAGEAGTITVAGKTTLLDGVLKAKALPGYQGASISLISDRITVGRGAPVPGTLVLNPDALKGMDLEQINIGYDPAADNPQDRIIAESVTLEGGSVINASTITVGGKREIVLKSGSKINAISDAGNGVVSLLAPEGKVVLEENTLVHASDRLNLEVKDMDLRGDIRVDNSGISLAGAKVFFVPDGYARTEPGLYLTQARWNQFRLFEEIGLKSGSDLLFLGDFILNVADSLSIDAARIAAAPATAGGTNDWNVNISAPKISLLNTGATSTNDASADTAGITLSAADLVIGHGDIRFDGFRQVNLASGSDLTFKGKGSLTTAGADLTLTAPRVTTSFYQNEKTSYEVARYTVNAGNKAVTLSSAQGAPGQSSVPGGMLELLARTIDVSTTVEVNSGTLRMTASGSGAGEGVFVREGAKLLVRGSENAPGGSVELRSAEGAVSVSAGALLDVSAGTQGDAGTVSIHAPVGGVNLGAALLGMASGGRGGSFEMDTKRISDFSSLNAALSSGGFTEQIDLHARTGNVAISPGQKVVIRKFKLVADQGNVSVYGELEASGISGGGIVELYAGNILTLYPDSKVLANGTAAGAHGGDVFLGTSGGYISTLAGSLIDVSGGEGGVGGTLSLRAPRFESGSVKEVFVLPFGTVKGARDVFVEAFKVYSHTADKTVTSDDFGTSTASGWWKETDEYMTAAAAIETRLLSTMVREGWTEDRFHLLPGIEVRSTGNLTLTSDWNLTPWRFGGEPGVLTLRSGGHLTLAANLTDKNSDSPGPGGRDSWALNLASGGVFSSADLLRTSTGAGTLTVSAQKLVYTESAPLRFTSGADVVVEQALLNFQGFSPWTPFLNMPGSLGTFDSLIQGSVAGNLTLQGSAILSATGDVDIVVGKNLDLDQKGWHSAIATFGLRTGDKTYARSGGGDIVLRVGGAVRTRNADTQSDIDLTTVPWDYGYKIRVGSSTYYDWGASFIIPEREALSPRPTLSTRGIAAMGGGDVRITVGRDFRAVAGSFGHALYARGSANPALAPATLYGGGDLLVSAGGDVTGRFLVTKGKGEINAMGALGSEDEKRRALLEGFDARLAATSQGAAYVGAVVNPGLVEKSYKTQARVLYTEESAALISSSRGDVVLYGDSPYHEAGTGEKVLPGTLEIVAGKNLLLLSDFALVPSRSGNLKLVAGLNIEAGLAERQARLERKLVMSDMAPSDIYGSYKPQLLGDLFGSTIFSPVPVHGSDPHPIEIAAGQDILLLKLFLPKQADILAGRDIRDLFLRGQNLADEDITRILAKGDILFSTDPRGAGASRDRDSGFEMGGPGIFTVQAGGLIDLGNAENGVRTVGGFYNSGLGEKGASLMVVTGAGADLIPDAVETFFSDLRKAGTEYSDLLAKGDRPGAQKKIDEARTLTIEPFLDKLSMEEGGNILMVNSQISTLSGKDDIFILASGRLDVGKSTFFTAEQERQSTGIFSAGGGAINLFTTGDLNVNESRVMSFRGGDITIWSDRGSVNAGRGDKTAISASPPRQVQIEGIGTPETTDDKYQLRFDPPSVGSGIRTLTYDPDGIEGPLKEPLAGDVYLFAPTGIIDAGEAGIAGRNVTLGATEVLNAQNISFSVGSVGVSTASQSPVGIGALSGVGSLTETSKMVEQAAGMAGSRADAAEAAKQAAKLSEDLVAKWLDVKVIGFEETGN